MTRSATAICGILLALVTAARGQTPVGLQSSLLYLDADDWSKQPSDRKIALANDFMRIFCTDQTMPAADLATCLDHDGAEGPMLDRAIACVRASPARGTP